MTEQTEYYMQVFAAQKKSFSFFSSEKSDYKFSFAMQKRGGLKYTKREEKTKK